MKKLKIIEEGYDDLGNIKSIQEPDGDLTEYTYDYSVYQVKTVTKPEGYKVSYDYDDMGNLQTETAPDQNKTEYAYDELYRVNKITEPGSLITEIRNEIVEEYYDKCC